MEHCVYCPACISTGGKEIIKMKKNKKPEGRKKVRRRKWTIQVMYTFGMRSSYEFGPTEEEIWARVKKNLPNVDLTQFEFEYAEESEKP